MERKLRIGNEIIRTCYTISGFSIPKKEIGEQHLNRRKSGTPIGQKWITPE